RRLRALRRRAHSGQHPFDPSVRALHPSRCVRQGRTEHGGVAVLHLLRRGRGDVLRGGDAVPPRACRQAARHPSARAAGGAAVTTEEKYVAAVYLVVFVVLLAYVFIIGLKLQRLEREVAELAELALRKRE